MSLKKLNPTLVDEGVGALAIATTVLLSPLLRPWYSRWGATQNELHLRLPGDEYVPDPVIHSTRAITITAPAAEIWPWLVQIGQGRGGWYSYERLENLVGCQMHNADEILPEHQQIEVGDIIRLAPEGRGPYFTVVAILPGRAIILGGDDPPTSWSLILNPIDSNTTRLVARFRQAYRPGWGSIIIWRVFTDPVSFWMERKMLQGIKARAEHTGSRVRV